MPASINPDLYCETAGCRAPREMGSDLCSRCGRLGGEITRRLAEREEDSAGISSQPTPLRTPIDIEAKPPRCIAYLSQAGDVITLELLREPRFTEVDVELCAKALMRKR